MSWVPIPSYQQPAPKLTQPPSPLFLSHARFINKAHAPISGSPFAKSHKMTRQAYSAGKQTLLSPFMTQVAPIPIRRSRSTYGMVWTHCVKSGLKNAKIPKTGKESGRERGGQNEKIPVE